MVSDFFEWRWAPCVGLTAGSLGFVALALLLIPTSVAVDPRAASTLTAFDSTPPQRALYGSSLARDLTDRAEAQRTTRVARSVPPPSPRSNETSPPPQRGFSPIIERPEPAPPPIEAVPPTAPAMPVAPPEPVPGSTVIIQPVPGGESREVTVQ
jgi:hypothetical protein